ncbi:phosphotransferase [Flavobacterium sp. F-380]|uniref:Phosphotransferase n=1 Tax=Flavobacterium kayseriense TaxID=2764714 RepID=A0ABR7JAM3_9FLAO|nr:phosphotransferase [Flavobacterium kayseriense]MBC5842584.1 phosphotransferase [Flavobacterium kayseriense]MBC5849114.1 phosphotransferase [Flavobacterium kayseriense]
MSTFPASASTLSENELGLFVRDRYNLDNSFTCKLYRTGLNHTYFISNGINKYVIRVYCHNWRSKAQIIEELELLTILNDNNVSVSHPIKDRNNNFIQEVMAAEGKRYIVLFSFAKGDKVRFISNENCAAIGAIMARIHNITEFYFTSRVQYTPKLLLQDAYMNFRSFFSEDLDEMIFIKSTASQIEKKLEFNRTQSGLSGMVHLDIWYDNLSINNENEITIFDFDNCGQGLFVLDVGYFCKQLFFIEQDKKVYEEKVKSFIAGYRTKRELSETEIKIIPEAGAAVFIFYLGVQAQRFDWSNIFFTENYLKMYSSRIKNWLEYYKINDK